MFIGCLKWFLNFLYRTALDRANAILFINTCSAMIVLYVIYIGAIYAKSNEHTCIVFAALFHYIFLVVVFALMLESGFFFIRRFWEKIERYSSAIAITTWSKYNIHYLFFFSIIFL